MKMSSAAICISDIPDAPASSGTSCMLTAFPPFFKCVNQNQRIVSNFALSSDGLTHSKPYKNTLQGGQICKT